MGEYSSPQITELGSIEAFTRGDKFAWELDGMTLAELVGHVVHGGNPADGLGYS